MGPSIHDTKYLQNKETKSKMINVLIAVHLFHSEISP